MMHIDLLQWLISLLPSLVIRFLAIKKRLSIYHSILLTLAIVIANLYIFMIVGPSIHSKWIFRDDELVDVIIASIASYLILRKENRNKKNNTTLKTDLNSSHK